MHHWIDTTVQVVRTLTVLRGHICLVSRIDGWGMCHLDVHSVDYLLHFGNILASTKFFHHGVANHPYQVPHGPRNVGCVVFRCQDFVGEWTTYCWWKPGLKFQIATLSSLCRDTGYMMFAEQDFHQVEPCCPQWFQTLIKNFYHCHLVCKQKIVVVMLYS